MKQSFITLLMTILPLIAGAFGIPYPFDDGDSKIELQFQLNPDGVSVSVSRPASPYVGQTLNIPSEVEYEGNKYPVTGIGAQAFHLAELSEVNIPSSVTFILAEAFKDSKIPHITFGSGLETIGNQAFYNSKITECELKTGLTTIGEYAFGECKNIKIVNLPVSLTSMGSHAFYGSGVTMVKIPGALESIQEGTFHNCRSLWSVKIEEGVENIGSYAFDWCEIDTLNLPNSIKSIGYRAFYDNPLKVLTFGDGITSIGSLAFYKARLTEEIILPGSLTDLGEEAFGGCEELRKISFPAALRHIPAKVCRSCPKLSEVEIPEGVISLGSFAFNGCKTFNNISLPNSIESFAAPGEVNPMGGNFGASGLASFTTPSKVKEIPDGFFASCINLTSIEIPDHIEKIGASVFSGCSSLTHVSLPDEFTEIPKQTFDNCNALREFKFPSKTKIIREDAFRGCTALESLDMPDALETVEKYAFYKCSSLKNVIFPPYVKNYYQEIFRECLSLESVTFSPCSEVIANCFAQCEALKEVHIPKATVPTAGTFGNSPQPIIYAPNNVTLYVPRGAKAAYESDQYWNTFYRIEEEDVENVKFGVTVSKSGNGTIEVNGTVAGYTPILVESGTEVKITITPEETWMVSSVLVNDKDVTDRLVNNTLTIGQATTNYNIDVVLTKAPVLLTVYSGAMGVVKIPYNYNTDARLYVEAADGWQIESVTLDYRDVTTEVLENKILEIPSIKTDATVNISYSKISSIDTVRSAGVTVRVDKSTIEILGLYAGEAYSVYDIAGTMLYSGESDGNVTTIDGLMNGKIYIVVTPAKTFKIAF